ARHDAQLVPLAPARAVAHAHRHRGDLVGGVGLPRDGREGELPGGSRGAQRRERALGGVDTRGALEGAGRAVGAVVVGIVIVGVREGGGAREGGGIDAGERDGPPRAGVLRGRRRGRGGACDRGRGEGRGGRLRGRGDGRERGPGECHNEGERGGEGPCH